MTKWSPRRGLIFLLIVFVGAVKSHHRTNPPAELAFLKHRTRHQRNYSGFTLSELLVAIGIIAILASLLTASIPRIAEHVNRTKCANNIRQQLVGLRALSIDRQEKYYWPAVSSGDDSAPLHLYPDYIDDLSVFVCPSTKNEVRELQHPVTKKYTDLQNNARNAGKYNGHSYEYFGFYKLGRKSPKHLTALPESVVLVVDGDDFGVNNVPDEENNHGTDGWNWGYADGHVEWITFEETGKTKERVIFSE